MNIQKFFLYSCIIVMLLVNVVSTKKNNGLAEYLGNMKVKDSKTYHGATDISESCKDGLYIKSYLPFHTGISDSDIRYLTPIDRHDSPYNCHITYTTPSDPENLGIIVVIEFTDAEPNKPHVCDKSYNELILTSHSEYTSACKNITLDRSKRTNVFAKFVPEQDIILHLKLREFYENIKITATSGKVLTSQSSTECDPSLEVTCDVSEKTFCIDKELQCDDNINCGSTTKYDEDHRICQGDKYKRLWVIVLYSVIILIIAGFFIINILYTCVPHIADNFFIFNEHEDNRLIVVSKSVTPRQNKKVVNEASLFIDTHRRSGGRNKGSLSNSSVFTFSSEWSSSDRSVVVRAKKNKSVETQKPKAAQKSTATQKSRNIISIATKKTAKFAQSRDLNTTFNDKSTANETPTSANVPPTSANVPPTSPNVPPTSAKVTPTSATGPPKPEQKPQEVKGKGLFVTKEPPQADHRPFAPPPQPANKKKMDPFKNPVRQFSGYLGSAKPPSKTKNPRTQSTMWKDKPMKK